MGRSSFQGVQLFSSGPERMVFEPLGSELLDGSRLNPPATGTETIGLLEVGFVVRGRLVAGTDAAMNSLVDAIRAKLTHPPQVGTLVDTTGRSWSDVAFVRFAIGDTNRIEHGRTVSLSYEARFLRVIQ